MQLRTATTEKTIRVARPFSPHPPSHKQRAFLDLDAEEGLFGGAAGGGKSDALILAALQYIDVPGYSSGLFRRTKEDLNKPGAILDRARNWFAGTSAKWDGDLHGFRFPTRSGQADATMHFGYAMNLDDVKNRYQGSEFQFIGVDELSQWPQSVYLYLFSRLRKLRGFPVPTRMRGTSNPGSEWVKDRFVSYARHVRTGIDAREALRRRRRGEPMDDPPYYQSPPSPEAAALARELGRTPQGAYFVPAFASDNPGLDLADYRSQLVKLDPVEREQLEHGDWDAIASGEFFKIGWFESECYLDQEPHGIRWIRYWDLAGTRARPGRDPDYSSGAKVGVRRTLDGKNEVIVSNVQHFREDPGETEANVRATAELDGKRVPIYIEEEPGSAGKNNTHNYASRILFGWQVHGHRKTGPKPEYWKALSGLARNKLLRLVRGEWNRSFVQELCGLPAGHDDQADAASGAVAMLISDNAVERARSLARIS